MAKAKAYKTPARVLKLRCELEDAVNKAKRYCDMNKKEICLSLGMSTVTLWSRLQNPDTFTLGELRTLAMLNGKEFPTFLADITK